MLSLIMKNIFLLKKIAIKKKIINQDEKYYV